MTNIDSSLVFNSPKFIKWEQKIKQSGTVIEDIDILGVISRDQKNLFGVFLDCIFVTPEAQRFKRCIFIRGESVVVVPVLKCIDDGETYTLLVEQWRPVDGLLISEFPGGMLDDMIDEPCSVAVREIQEELSLDVTSDDLVLLSEEPIRLCTSTMDEVTYYYSFTKEVSKEYINDLNNKRTGLHDEDEYIIVKAVKMDMVMEFANANTIIGLKLLEKKLNRIFL